MPTSIFLRSFLQSFVSTLMYSVHDILPDRGFRVKKVGLLFFLVSVAVSVSVSVSFVVLIIGCIALRFIFLFFSLSN